MVDWMDWECYYPLKEYYKLWFSIWMLNLQRKRRNYNLYCIELKIDFVKLIHIFHTV